MLRRNHWIYIMRYTAYFILMILLYALETTPHFLELFSIKPLLLPTAAMAVAMYEGEFVGGIFGGLAGLLCDMSIGLLFGFNGILLLICCVAAGLLVIYLLKMGLRTAWYLSLGALFLIQFCDFFFSYVIWSYEGAGRLFLGMVVPTVLYSSIYIVLFYWLIGKWTVFCNSLIKT